MGLSTAPISVPLPNGAPVPDTNGTASPSGHTAAAVPTPAPVVAAAAGPLAEPGAATQAAPPVAMLPQVTSATEGGGAAQSAPGTAQAPTAQTPPVQALSAQTFAAQAIVPPSAPLQPGSAAPAPSAPAPSATAPSHAAPLPTHQLAPALLQLAQGPSGTAVTLRLDPAELGYVQVRIERDTAGTATVQVTAERPETLHLLTSDQAQLHRVLDNAGVPAEGRTVSFALDARSAPDAQPAPSPAAHTQAGGPQSGGSQSGGPQNGGSQSGSSQAGTPQDGNIQAGSFAGTGSNGGGQRSGGRAGRGSAFWASPDEEAVSASPLWLRAGVDITA